MHWLPPNGALQGIALDHLLQRYLSIMFWLFIAAQVLILAAMFRRRSTKNPRAASSGQSRRVFVLAELLPLLAICGLFIWMIFTSHHLWAARREHAAGPHALQVEVTGVQFQWYFRYPGPDGVYGTLRPELVNAPAGNPLGLDLQDPHSADDVVSSILMLPADRPVNLNLRSQDVIHGFFIPGMRLKQDTIPGMRGQLTFTPATPGDYPILCTQVCGLGHARMQARLRVLSQANYDRWLTAREQSLRAAEAAR